MTTDIFMYIVAVLLVGTVFTQLLIKGLRRYLKRRVKSLTPEELATGKGFSYNVNGTKMYVPTSHNNDTFDIFELSEAFAPETATYADTITGEELTDMKYRERSTLNEKMSTVTVGHHHRPSSAARLRPPKDRISHG